MPIVCFADDLTGALEAGARFRAAGAGVEVRLESNPLPVLDSRLECLVVNLETRHLPALEAQRKVRIASRSLAGSPATRIFKKTDSTLRGNVAPEVAALLEEFPSEPLVYAGAFPAMGRTVRNGRVLVDGVPVAESHFGRDALNPVRESSIVRLFEELGVPVRCCTPRGLDSRDPGVWVVDAETGEDLLETACAIERLGVRLVAGTAAICSAGLFGLKSAAPQEWPAAPTCLVVNGSRHPRSLEQASHVRSSAGSWCLFEGENPAAHPEEVWKTFDDNPASAILVFGGDTASALMHSRGIEVLRPIGEVVPGVPVSAAPGGLLVITKAGGFGPPNVVEQIREILKG